MLDVVGTALKDVNTRYRKRRQHEQEEQKAAHVLAEQAARLQQRIKEGVWHDPRLDCVAGNGIMSELGVGDEWFGADDADAKLVTVEASSEPEHENEKEEKEKTPSNGRSDNLSRTEDSQPLDAMPIIILRGYEAKGGGAKREDLLNVISQWAAGLAEGQVRMSRYSRHDGKLTHLPLGCACYRRQR